MRLLLLVSLVGGKENVGFSFLLFLLFLHRRILVEADIEGLNGVPVYALLRRRRLGIPIIGGFNPERLSHSLSIILLINEVLNLQHFSVTSLGMEV